MDGVKVDCQSTLDMIGSSLGGGPALAAGYHAALEDSVAEHFPGNACINCMCHSTSDLYRHASPCPCLKTTQLLQPMQPSWYSHLIANMFSEEHGGCADLSSPCFGHPVARHF